MKKIILLCLLLVATLGANASITVCNIDPDENGHFNCSYIKSGSITWNEINHTLTLDNAVVEYTCETPYDYVYPIKITEDVATIVIHGTCKLLTDGFVALSFDSYNRKSVTIQGDGSLYTSSSWIDLHVKTTELTIKDIYLETVNGIGDNGNGVWTGLTFDNVQAYIKGQVERIGEGITFRNCAITYPADAYISETEGYGYAIWCGNEQIPDHIVISRGSNIKGDVNNDGEVTVADINAVIKVILGNGTNMAADVNKDGEIGIADINAIINIILGGGGDGKVITINASMVNHMYNTVTSQVAGVTKTSNKLILDTISHTSQVELVYNDGSEHTVSYNDLTAHASRMGFYELSSRSDPNFNGYVDFNEGSLRYIYRTDDGLRIISTTPEVFFLKTHNTIVYDDATATTQLENVIYQFDLNADERTATVMVMDIVHAKDMRHLMRVAANNVPFTLTPNGYSFTGENIPTTSWYRTADDPAIKTTSEYPFETLNINVDLMNDQLVANYMLGPHATVTATGKTYSSPAPDGHEWVDLGLPSGTLWATCNVGANSPEEYGDYFAWGETAPKDVYNWGTYKWCNNGDNHQITKYCTMSEYGYNGFTDGKTELDSEDDAAYVNWGPQWRTPDKAQQDELREQCTWTWVIQNGVEGRLVTGPNGNTLFLPASGFRSEGSLYDKGSYGHCWSRYSDFPLFAYYLYFTSPNVGSDRYNRYCGRPVRAVRVSQN